LSLFDRLLEQHLQPTSVRAATPPPASAPKSAPSNAAFEQKRSQWREEALARTSTRAAPTRELKPSQIEEMLARPPAPPPPKPVDLRKPLVPVGSCKAINPDTGRQCALLAGHTKPHRHGTTEFITSARPGQQHFSRRDALDRQASSRSGSVFTTPATGE